MKKIIISVIIILILLFIGASGYFLYQKFYFPKITYIITKNINSALIGEWDGDSTPVLNSKYVFDNNDQVTHTFTDGTIESGSWQVIHDLNAEHIAFPKTVTGKPDWDEAAIKSFDNNYLKLTFKDFTQYFGFVFSEDNGTQILTLYNMQDGSIMGYSKPLNQNASLKTYINTQYGFSFKYPSDWVLRTIDTGVYVLTKQHDQMQTPDGKTVDFSVRPCNLSEQWCIDAKQYFDQTRAFYAATQNVAFSIDGVSGSQYVVGAAQYAYTAGIVANGIFYTFGSNVDDYNTRYPNAMSNADVKAIFNSFKLTNPPSNQINWKTYTDSTLKFSIDYPASWASPKISSWSKGSSVSFLNDIFYISDAEYVDPSTGGYISFDKNAQQTFQTLSSQKNVTGLTQSKIMLGGVNAIQISYVESGTSLPGTPPNSPAVTQKIIRVFAPDKAGGVFDISYQFLLSDKEAQVELFNHMVSTFKFTK